jgi:hypothetical protein
MSTKENLLKAHASMADVLDAKLKDMPEWQAFKAIDTALREYVETSKPRPQVARKPTRKPRGDSRRLTYSQLAAKALEATNTPIQTTKLVEFIGQYRTIKKDPVKARVNVGSALSHDSKFQNIEWNGARAWWWSDRPLPKNETANLN